MPAILPLTVTTITAPLGGVPEVTWPTTSAGTVVDAGSICLNRPQSFIFTVTPAPPIVPISAGVR